MDAILLGSTLKAWAIAAAITAAAALGLWAIKHVVLKRLDALSSKTDNRIDDIVVHSLKATKWFFYGAVSLYLGSRALHLTPGVARGLDAGIVIAVLLQVGIWIHAAVGCAITVWRDSHDGKGDATMVAGIAFVARLVAWFLVLVLMLSNLGIEISALVAGLGIGGIAAALAVQSLLGDLFASVSIYFDRPFDIGDFIIVGDMLGTVDRIGMRSTHVRSLWGEMLVFPNADLAKSRIKNYGRMQERRVAFDIGIEYGTPADKVERVAVILREVIEAIDDVRFDRSHFKAYGDYALVFETVYYVLSADYNVFMDKQQAINLAIYRRFEDEGVSFAFPTQKLHLESREAMRRAA